MRAFKLRRRSLRAFTSLMLIISMMFSLCLPINLSDISVFAEDAATGNDICAYLLFINPDLKIGEDINPKNNLELVFAKSGTTFTGRTVYKSYTNFADKEYVKTTYSFDANGRINVKYNYPLWDGWDREDLKNDRLPWYNDSNTGIYIRKVTFKDKIAPKSIAGWFYNCRYLAKIENINNLDTSKCENMTMAFWYSNTGATDLVEPSGTTTGAYLKDLDLSGWDTSKVKKFDYMIYSTKLENLNISGMDLTGVDNNIATVAKYGDGSRYPEYTGAVRDVRNLVYGGLSGSIDISNVDLSKIEYLRNFITNTKLQEIDASTLIGPEHAYGCDYMFQNNKNLTSLILGSDTHELKVGTEPMYLGVPRNGYDNPFTAEDESEGGTVLTASNNKVRNQSMWFGDFVSGCSSLETIDLEHLKITVDGSDYSDDAGKAKGLENGVIYQLNTFFKGCTSLQEIKHLDRLGLKAMANGNWVTRGMFQDCKSLVSIDMGDYEGFLGGPYVFNNCESLKELNLAGMGKVLSTDQYKNNNWYQYFMNRRAFNSFNTYTEDGVKKSQKNNIFAGCTELSKVTLGEYYITDGTKAYNSTYGTYQAIDALKYYGQHDNYNLVGEDVPDIPPVGDDRIWIKTKDLYNDTSLYTKADPAELVPVGTELTTYKLFAEYEPKYAGTWVTASKIALIAQGGTPYQQTVDGSVDLPVNYDSDSITTPERTGYDFLYWYAPYGEDSEKRLDEQLAANKDGDPTNDEIYVAWAYYAKWKEHEYKIRLHKNVVPQEDEQPGDVVEYTVKYSEALKLPDNIFTQENPNSVITSWNMRSNGSGSSYATNDSVDKLTAEDGGVIDLFAQWHTPAAVVTFDTTSGVPEGVTDIATPVGRRDYEDAQNDLYSTYYNTDGTKTTRALSTSHLNDDYSFEGWYSPVYNRIITDDDRVSQNETLVARWVLKPRIKFILGDGHITLNDEGSYTKICEYNQPIGEVPVPVKENATFLGWYTAQTGGDKIDTYATKATTDKEYYAHWGYQPKFDTNGGSYLKDANDKYINPNFEAKVDTSEVTFTSENLPKVEKTNSTFLGWYRGATQICDGEYNIIGGEDGKLTIDLSDGDTLQAHWSESVVRTVKLYKETSDKSDTPADDHPFQVIKVYNGNSVGQYNIPTKANCDFAGWYADGASEPFKDTDSVNSDLDLFAKWTDVNHTVTFHANGGTLADAPGEDTYTVTVSDGKTVNPLPGANMTETINDSVVIKKAFKGWNTKEDGTGTWLDSSTQISADTDYFAQWEDRNNLKTVDDYEYKTMIQWGTLSDSSRRITNNGDTLIFYPSTDVSGEVSASLNLLFDKPSNKELAKGDVRIQIPCALYKDWAGNPVGNDDVAGAVTFDPDNLDADFYAEKTPDGKYYIITNQRNIERTVSEFKLNYSVNPINVKGGYTDNDGQYQNYYTDTSPEKFEVKIELKDENGDYQTLDSRNLNVEFHNEVKPTVTKTKSDIYYKWQTAWGSEPLDSDDYIYIKWKLTANVAACNQPYKLSWSEDTVHDGAVVYCDGPGLENWTSELQGGTYTVNVVTKHLRGDQGGMKKFNNEAILNLNLKSDTEKKAVQKYRVSGETYAFIDIITGEGDRELIKYVYDPYVDTESNDKHYRYGGQDLVLSKSIESMKSDLEYYIKYYEKYNVDNPTTLASGEVSTKTRRYVFTDGLSGDLKIAKMSKKNASLSEEKNLEDSDYRFKYLDFSITEYTAKYLGKETVTVNGVDTEKDRWSAPYAITNSADYGSILVYIRRANTSDFELYKTVSASDLVNPSQDSEGYGYSERNLPVKKAKVELPANTVGFKVEYSSNKYTTDIKIHAAMGLKSSNRLYSLVSNHVLANCNTQIYNKCDLDIYRNGVKDAATMSSAKFDKWYASHVLTISESELYARKISAEQKAATQNYFYTDAGASTVTYSTAIEGWVKSKSSDGYIKRVSSCVFYDLLPKGHVVDKNSIWVVARNRQINGKGQNTDKAFIQQSNYKIGDSSWFTQTNDDGTKKYVDTLSPDTDYSVKFSDNWNNTGQTMMIIKISSPDDISANGFAVYYYGTTSINNLHINGTNPVNYVSFTDTTLGQSEPSLRSSDYSTLDKSIKHIYEEIDNSQTAYANGTVKLQTPSLYQYGADSHVTTEGSDMARHQVVGLNQSYNYHTFYEGSSASQTDDLVIYDVLERQIGGNDSVWTGTFAGIDVSNITKKDSANGNGKCAPKVYYSTKHRGEFTKEMFDVDAYPDIWSTVPPADLSTVTAVAVDCRKTENDKDFLLKIKDGVDFTINMISPSDESLAGKYTYNEAVIKGWNKEIGSPVNSSARTSVELRYTPPKFVKTAFPPSTDDVNDGGVVYNSVLDYILKITNPDTEVNMNEIVVRDTFPISLLANNTITVKFGKGQAIPIEQSARVTSTITSDEVNGTRTFEATIDTLDPGDSVEITIPVQVTAPKGTPISNTAEIVSINGKPFKPEDVIKSNTTSNTVTEVLAKILKVDGKGEPLPRAKLQILDPDNENKPIELIKVNKDGTKQKIDNEDNIYETDGTVCCFVAQKQKKYILHEVSSPSSDYIVSADIPFEIDIEGVLKQDGKAVPYITMVDEPKYKVVFHSNHDEIEEDVFNVVQCQELVNNKVTKFSKVPEIEGNHFTSFKGWYTAPTGGDRIDFSETYDGTTGNFETVNGVRIYNLYAQWQDYKVIFHENKPDDVNKEFRTYENKERSAIPVDGKYYLDREFKVTHFYDIPSFAKDDYVFAGWYHNEDYSIVTPQKPAVIPADFENDKYLKRDGLSDPDYHLYAKWIEVGTVPVERPGDTNENITTYSGFGLAGVQIRPEDMYDPNERDNPGDHPAQLYLGGLRFVTSLKESLINDIKNINKIEKASDVAKSFGVEYGYVAGRYKDADDFYKHYSSPSGYKLEYKGENVNGKDTTGGALTAKNDYRYIQNINCTSKQKGTAGTGIVMYDHRNLTNYRLYTLVITYENDTDGTQKAQDLVARAYLRYYDGNGKLRVFYNDYNDTASYYGGCKCNYTQVLEMFNQNSSNINGT